MPKPPPKLCPVEDADVLPHLGLLALAFVLGILAGAALACLTMKPSAGARAAPPSSVLHGVGSRAFVAALLQALPPTIAEPSHG